MPTPTPKKAEMPHLPTGQELYDQIMGHIEPDLTTENMKTLEQKYQGESAEQQAARKQRYELAFERYQQAYEGYIETLTAQVERYRKESINQVEIDDKSKEKNFLQGIENSFLSAA